MKPFTYLKPAANDVLGDRWASRVTRLYHQALERLQMPEIGPGMGAVYNLFQWAHCEAAGMRGSVVASPEAMIACGWSITEDLLQKVDDLLQAAGEILQEEVDAAKVTA